jgi:K+-sensing histidine kinase KdpD
MQMSTCSLGAREQQQTSAAAVQQQLHARQMQQLLHTHILQQQQQEQQEQRHEAMLQAQQQQQQLQQHAERVAMLQAQQQQQQQQQHVAMLQTQQQQQQQQQHMGSAAINVDSTTSSAQARWLAANQPSAGGVPNPGHCMRPVVSTAVGMPASQGAARFSSWGAAASANRMPSGVAPQLLGLPQQQLTYWGEVSSQGGKRMARH